MGAGTQHLCSARQIGDTREILEGRMERSRENDAGRSGREEGRREGQQKYPSGHHRLLSLAWGRVPSRVATPTCWVTRGVSLGSASFSNTRELDPRAPKYLLVLRGEKGRFPDNKSLQHPEPRKTSVGKTHFFLHLSEVWEAARRERWAGRTPPRPC